MQQQINARYFLNENVTATSGMLVRFCSERSWLAFLVVSFILDVHPTELA